MNIFEQENFTQGDVEALINNQAEESVQLEFKEARSLDTSDNKKTEISKDVSAFANSAGGILIYGIEEENMKAKAVSFIDGNKYSAEWLEQVIGSKIQRRISDLKVFPILFNNDIAKSVYVVKIPQSFTAPHMASNHKFYKRYNFESVAMEEYEVRDLYFRTSKTQLSIEGIEIYKITPERWGVPERQKLIVLFGIIVTNSGNVVEKLFKTEVRIPLSSGYVNESHTDINAYFVNRNSSEWLFSIPNKAPIFQNERFVITKINLYIDQTAYKNLLKNPINVKLYYTAGVEQRDLYMLDLIPYNNENLSSETYQKFFAIRSEDRI